MGVSANPLRVNTSLNFTRFCGSCALKPHKSHSCGSILTVLMALPSLATAIAIYLVLLIKICTEVTFQGQSTSKGRNTPLDHPLFSVVNRVAFWGPHFQLWRLRDSLVQAHWAFLFGRLLCHCDLTYLIYYIWLLYASSCTSA